MCMRVLHVYISSGNPGNRRHVLIFFEIQSGQLILTGLRRSALTSTFFHRLSQLVAHMTELDVTERGGATEQNWAGMSWMGLGWRSWEEINGVGRSSVNRIWPAFDPDKKQMFRRRFSKLDLRTFGHESGVLDFVSMKAPQSMCRAGRWCTTAEHAISEFRTSPRSL